MQNSTHGKMASLCRIWSWFFDVSNPNDPKLRRWLHPTCALAFNAGLALLVAVAAFLAAPSEFHELWLQRQTPAVAHFAQHLTDLATSVGLVSLPAFQWLRRTAAALLLPQELMFDRKQAFALYSWDKGSIDPKSLGIFLAVYVALMLASRLYEKGAMMLYDAAWACNLSLALTALGEELRSGLPYATSTQHNFALACAIGKYLVSHVTVLGVQRFG